VCHLATYLIKQVITTNSQLASSLASGTVRQTASQSGFHSVSRLVNP